MSKEKQIEEMARIFAEGDGLRRCWDEVCETCKFFSVDENYCRDCFGATALHDAGYRQQEWISVNDRLPTDERDVLAYYGFDRGDGDLGMMFIGVLSYFAHDPKPHFQHEGSGLRVTHWMPLPEPPKMEGGE